MLSLDRVCHWLVEASGSPGHPCIAEVLLQILESTMMPTVIHDPHVQMELLKILETHDPGPALESINVILDRESRTSEIAQMYIRTLHHKHANCTDPPFGPLSSQLWYYQSWDTVSHFNNLLLEL